MNLELTDDQEFFRETTRRFIESGVPMATVRQWHDLQQGYDRDWWRSAAELGWTAMFAPSAAGGGSLSGQPLADAAIIAEEMGRSLTPGPYLPANVVVAALSGTDGDQHAGALAEIVAGHAVAAWALGEPGSRWAPDEIETTVEVRGGDLVVNGTKAYVEGARESDYLLVVGRSGEGLTQVLVPAGTHGLTVDPLDSLDLGRRFGQVELDRVRVPRSALVGQPGLAGDDVEHQLRIALVLQGAETVGILDRTFQTTLEYMNERFAFGRPISSYQALKHRIADLLLMLETAKGCVDAATAACDAGATDAGTEARVVKTYVGGKSMHVIQECMQFHGGISMTWEHDIHLYLRRATVNRAVLGTPEQHLEAMASLLGIPGPA